MSKRYYDVRELAELLGCSVSTVWRHVQKGVLPRPFRIGGLTRWDGTEIDATLAQAKEEAA